MKNHHVYLSVLLMVLIALLSACIVAPPDFREVKVGEMRIELPGPGDSIMGRHRMGDTLRFRVEAWDNRDVSQFFVRLTPAPTAGSTSLRNFLEYNLSGMETREFELEFRIVLQPDTVEQTLRFDIFDPPADNGILVKSIFGLEAGGIEEFVFTIMDDQRHTTSQPYSFLLEE